MVTRFRNAGGAAATAISELVYAEAMHSSGFFLKKKPPFIALKGRLKFRNCSTAAPELRYPESTLSRGGRPSHRLKAILPGAPSISPPGSPPTRLGPWGGQLHREMRGKRQGAYAGFEIALGRKQLAGGYRRKTGAPPRRCGRGRSGKHARDLPQFGADAPNRSGGVRPACRSL